MRLFLILFVFVLANFSSYGQVFYVEPTEKGFENKIVEKMKYEGFKVVTEKQSSDYTIECLITGQYNAFKVGHSHRGYVRTLDSKTGDEVARTKEVAMTPAAVNGFQAGPKIMHVISEKHLLPGKKAI